MGPVIGVTAGHRVVASSAVEERAHLLYAAYTAMVRAANGVPVLLVPVADSTVDTLLDRIDGLILTGGGDVDPQLYDGDPHPAVYDLDPERDEFEWSLSIAAAARRMPTLAVCRGMQILNVSLGGTLIPHILDSVPDALDHWIRGEDAHAGVHEVAVEPGSTTAAALGTTALPVNSVHHQGIGRLGDGLRITARAPDGVVEALEPADPTWPMWAIQWHPEWLGPEHGPSLRLFTALVEAARKAADRSG